jgi:hypothetical protein
MLNCRLIGKRAALAGRNGITLGPRSPGHHLRLCLEEDQRAIRCSTENGPGICLIPKQARAPGQRIALRARAGRSSGKSVEWAYDRASKIGGLDKALDEVSRVLREVHAVVGPERALGRICFRFYAGDRGADNERNSNEERYDKLGEDMHDLPPMLVGEWT